MVDDTPEKNSSDVISLHSSKNSAQIGLESTYGKKPVSADNLESREAMSVEEIENRLNRVSGVMLHLIMHKLCVRKYVHELESGEKDVNEVSLTELNSGVEFHPSEGSQYEMELLGVSTKTPRINIVKDDKVDRELHVEVGSEGKKTLSQTLETYTKKRWEQIGIFGSAFIEGIDSHPYFNSENIVFASEVTLPAVTGHLKQISMITQDNPIEYRIAKNPRESSKKETLHINMKQVLKDSTFNKDEILEENSVDNFLYEIMIQGKQIIDYFPKIKNKLDTLGVGVDDVLVNFDRRAFDLQITDMVRRGEIESKDLETIIAMRVLSQAVHEANFFIGGRVSLADIKSADELKIILKDLGSNKSKSKYEDLEKMRSEFSTERFDYREPSGIRPDLILFEMPEEMSSDQKEYLNQMRNYLAEEYDHHSNPPLLIDMKFYELLDKGVNLGMKIKTVDLKTSLKDKDEVEMVRYIKELYYYAISMAQGVAAYRKHKDPTSRFDIYDLLNDPILKAHVGSEILMVNMVGEGDNIGAKMKQIRDKKGLFSGENARKFFSKFYNSLHETVKRMVVARNLKE